MDDRFTNDAFFVDQLIRPVGKLYRISTLGSDGTSAGEPLAFARNKFALKEEIRFFADEGETRELFRLKARRFIVAFGRYDLTTPSGERLGVLENPRGVRSPWRILDAAEQEIATAQEGSTSVAVLRRMIDFPMLFYVTISMEGRPIGELARHRVGLRDRYILKLGGDPDRRLDRRVAVALAVWIDTF